MMDRDTGVYADGSKVHAINFKGRYGRYFQSRGPLNTVRAPQGCPMFVQAGGSPRGRELAAKYNGSIIATATGIEGIKIYRNDVRIGGDGSLITRPGQTGLTRQYTTEITDGLVSALQRRGLARMGYTHAHFRDNLLEF